MRVCDAVCVSFICEHCEVKYIVTSKYSHKWCTVSIAVCLRNDLLILPILTLPRSSQSWRGEYDGRAKAVLQVHNEEVCCGAFQPLSIK
jgi:hypothetical protein